MARCSCTPRMMCQRHFVPCCLWFHSRFEFYDNADSSLCALECCNLKVFNASNMCATHTFLPKQGVCPKFGCDKLECEDKENEGCKIHCENIKHKHCSIPYCDKTQKCKRTNRCISHCEAKTHKHCSHHECEKPSHEGSVKCLLHCRKSDHGHCKRACDNADEECTRPHKI